MTRRGKRVGEEERDEVEGYRAVDGAARNGIRGCVLAGVRWGPGWTLRPQARVAEHRWDKGQCKAAHRRDVDHGDRRLVDGDHRDVDRLCSLPRRAARRSRPDEVSEVQPHLRSVYRGLA